MNNKTLKEQLEEGFIKALIGAAGVSIVTAFAFYFNTNHAMAMHSKDIDELKITTQKLKESVNAIRVVPTLNKQEIQFIKNEVKELKESQRGIIKTQQEMLKILYKIDKKR